MKVWTRVSSREKKWGSLQGKYQKHEILQGFTAKLQIDLSSFKAKIR